MSADVSLMRVTPTGVLLGEPLPRSDEWFALRRAGITATDIPKILGLSQYGNAYSVWLDKRGELWGDSAGEAATWGTLMEGVVADEWGRRHDLNVYALGVIANAEATWMRASLDRLVTNCGDQECALEVKTRSAFKAGQWRQDIPDDVLAQVAWQRLVTGVPHIHVAVLIGGNRLIEHRYDRDDDLEQYIHDAAETLWRHVEDATEPDMPLDEVTVGLLSQMDRAGVATIAPEEADELRAQYREACDLEAKAKAAKTHAKAAILNALGDGDELTDHDGHRVATFKASERRSADLDRLATERPTLYAALTARNYITTTRTRALRVDTKADPK